MSGNPFSDARFYREFSDDEVAIINFCRERRLSKFEALKRLSTPAHVPAHIQGQELAANLVVGEELSVCQADPVALSGHDEPA